MLVNILGNRSMFEHAWIFYNIGEQCSTMLNGRPHGSMFVALLVSAKIHQCSTKVASFKRGFSSHCTKIVFIWRLCNIAALEKFQSSQMRRRKVVLRTGKDSVLSLSGVGPDFPFLPLTPWPVPWWRQGGGETPWIWPWCTSTGRQTSHELRRVWIFSTLLWRPMGVYGQRFCRI